MRDALERAFDVAAALAGLTLGAPLLAAAALAVRLDTPGPVLFRQVRIGRGGEPFTMYKVRTMVAAAPGPGPSVTRAGDPRVTRVGRHLRRYKLDELPQLVNVLRGEMSIVGPRPETPDHADVYTGELARILSIRPGLVCHATITYRDEEALLAGVSSPEEHYRETILPAKLRLDLAYVERRSLRAALVILARAAWVVART